MHTQILRIHVIRILVMRIQIIRILIMRIGYHFTSGYIYAIFPREVAWLRKTSYSYDIRILVVPGGYVSSVCDCMIGVPVRYVFHCVIYIFVPRELTPRP